ncbi:MAG TPA: hypothetical protein VJT31_04950 [Rugosimonospora sp.]|nr:hypothetical protein [Rugosimonospora sp.]
MDADLAAKAAALAPDTVLQILASATIGVAVDQRPVVRLWIAAGHVVEGRLLGVGAERGDEVVVIGVQAARHQRLDEVVYLRMRDVISAGVLAPEQFRDVLSGGVLPLASAGRPVSRLALRREYASMHDLPLRLDWAAMPDPPAATANLAALLAALHGAVSAVRADDLGRAAWAAVTTVRVEHRVGEPLGIERSPGELLVVVDLTAALPRGLDAEIARRLNTVL